MPLRANFLAASSRSSARAASFMNVQRPSQVDADDELGLGVDHRAVARLALGQRACLGARLGDVALDRDAWVIALVSSRSGAMVVSCSIRWPSRWRLTMVPCQRRPVPSSRRIVSKNSGGCSPLERTSCGRRPSASGRV